MVREGFSEEVMFKLKPKGEKELTERVEVRKEGKVTRKKREKMCRNPKARHSMQRFRN